LARQLAEGNSASDGLEKTSMKASLMKASTLQKIMTEEKIALTELSPDIPEEIMVEGKPKTLVLEIFNEETLKASMTSSGTLQKKAQLPGYGVIEDDEVFWDSNLPTVTVPAYLSYDENGTTSVVEEQWILPYASDIDSIDDVFNMAIDEKMSSLEYPMFVVTIETPPALQQDPPVEQIQLSKMSAVQSFLVLKGIRLRVERDGWTHEEVELWYGKEGTRTYKYNNSSYTVTTTIVRYGWNMNGHTRKDASGVSRYFSDVNKKHKWYADQGWDVRLMALDNIYPRTLVAWEDDDESGRICRYYEPWTPNVALDFDPVDSTRVVGQQRSWEVWDLSDNSIKPHTPITTHIGGPGHSYIDQDDRFGESGVIRITDANVQHLSPSGVTFHSSNASPSGLGDIYYRFAWSSN